MAEKAPVSYPCYVSLPDNTLYQVEITAKCNGQHCLDKICRLLGIVAECDYFGLQYLGNKKELLWLNMKNKLSRQIHGVPPYKLLFRVKFYVEPHQLLLEETRHQFYLNIRWHLIRDTWCEPGTLSTEQQAQYLSLMAQATYGDFNARTSMSKYPSLWTVVDDDFWIEQPNRRNSHRSSMGSNGTGSHRSSLSSSFSTDDPNDVLPPDVLAAMQAIAANSEGGNNDSVLTTGRVSTPPDVNNQLDDELLRLTREMHKDLVGLEKQTVEYRLLQLAKKDTMAYGTSYHAVEDCFQQNQLLGVGPDSIWVTTPERKVLNRYMYTNVSKISEANRVFFFTVNGEQGLPGKELGYRLVSSRATMDLSRIFTETHCFFKSETVRPEIAQQVSRSMKGAINSLLQHDKSGDKHQPDFVFDIRYTVREIYDNARRQLYQTSASLQQQADSDDVFPHPNSGNGNANGSGLLHSQPPEHHLVHMNSHPTHGSTTSSVHHHHHHHTNHLHHHNGVRLPLHHPHAPPLGDIGKSHSLDFELGLHPPTLHEEKEDRLETPSPNHSQGSKEGSPNGVTLTSPSSTVTRPVAGHGKRSRLNSTNSEASSGSNNSSNSYQEEVDYLKAELARHEDSQLCQVCMERELARLFMPCGHLVCCAECALQVECCPLCRSPIEKRQPVYLPWRVPMSVGSGKSSPVLKEEQ